MGHIGRGTKGAEIETPQASTGWEMGRRYPPPRPIHQGFFELTTGDIWDGIIVDCGSYSQFEHIRFHQVFDFDVLASCIHCKVIVACAQHVIHQQLNSEYSISLSARINYLVICMRFILAC